MDKMVYLVRSNSKALPSGTSETAWQTRQTRTKRKAQHFLELKHHWILRGLTVKIVHHSQRTTEKEHNSADKDTDTLQKVWICQRQCHYMTGGRSGKVRTGLLVLLRRRRMTTTPLPCTLATRCTVTIFWSLSLCGAYTSHQPITA